MPVSIWVVTRAWYPCRESKTPGGSPGALGSRRWGSGRRRCRLRLAALERRGRGLGRAAVIRRVPAERQAVEVLLRRQVAEQLLEGLAVDGLLGDQLLGERVQAVAMDLEDLRCPLVRTVDDRADLLVDRLGDL